jgi:predicted dehydrogenase
MLIPKSAFPPCLRDACEVWRATRAGRDIPDPDKAMIEEFVAGIRENRAPSVTWEDGYEALKIALAAYQSAELGRPVRIENA